MSRTRKKETAPPEQLRARENAENALGCKPIRTFDYNLSYENEYIFACCAVSEIEMVFCNDKDETVRIPLSSLGEIRLTRNVGCVALECKQDGEDKELCRADMKHCRAFEGIAVDLEHLRQGRPPRPQREMFCKKCGRPLPENGTNCVFCADRKKLAVRLFGFAGGEYTRLIFGGIFLLLIAGAQLIAPRIQQKMTDGFLSPTDGLRGTENAFAVCVGLLALCGFAVALFSTLQRTLIAKSASRILVRIRRTVYEKVQSLSLSGISKRSAGDMISRLSGDIQHLRGFLANTFPQLLRQGVTLLIAFFLLVRRNWLLTVLIVLPVPLLVLLFMTVNRLTRRIYERQWQLEREANDFLHDVFSGIREVKVFGTEEREKARFGQLAGRIAYTAKRNETIWALTVPFSRFLLGVGEFLTLFIVGTDVIAGKATPGELIAFSAYVATLYGPIVWFAQVPRTVTQAMLSMSKISDLLDEEEVMPDGLITEHSLEGEITFVDASFGYKAPDYVLKHLDLEIRKGDFIGLVGRSGVGKSTAINLILRMYDVNEGKVLIDGEDIRLYNLNTLRSQVGVVLQETYLFNGTIYSNLSYAKPDASREEVLRAAILSGAHSFIMKLPDGYNTYVSAKGNNLSGGEKQRIAIARAILRNPKLLILDEATSSLDTETEKQIQDALYALSKGRTTVAIAHRLSTLRNATKLAVFEKGELEELGTHEELMQKEGRYYRLVMAQREMNRMKS